jgi:tetratricopeptide (TPR) repeat protein
MAPQGIRPQPAPETLTAQQKRLDKLFDHATQKTAKDFDYATDLLSQCVMGDASRVKYAKAYLDNLRKKYKNNRKGSPLAMFKERASRKAMRTALDQGHWAEVVQHSLKVLTVNPWDVPTLTALAVAVKQCGHRDCELYYLRAAWSANPQDVETNRRCAIALGERGFFDQAVACWHRVEEARPGDEEVKRAISALAVQKSYTGGELVDDEETLQERRRNAERQEEELRQSLAESPAPYLELAEIYAGQERYKDAEEVLAKAYQLAGEDPDIREKWEDARLRHLRQEIAQCEDTAAQRELRTQYFAEETEVWKNRVARYPSNLAFRYELGYRYLLSKRYGDAIGELQVAKADPRKRGLCLLALGQCFQQIKQYRLAKSHYESAVEEIPERDADNRKRALYLAGRLALALNDVDAAQSHLSVLAGVDFGYRDVAVLLNKIAGLRRLPQPAGTETVS